MRTIRLYPRDICNGDVILDAYKGAELTVAWVTRDGHTATIEGPLSTNSWGRVAMNTNAKATVRR